MKNMPVWLVVIVATATFSSAALAQNKSGFGIDAGIGTSVIRDEDGTETFRGSSFGFTLGAEYRFNRHFALGFNVFDLGDANDTFAGVDTDIEVRGFGFRARAILPISDQSDLYAILAGNNYYADLEPGGASSPFGSGAWELGIGGDFGLSEDLAVRVEGRFLNGDRDESAGLVTVGLSYRF